MRQSLVGTYNIANELSSTRMYHLEQVDSGSLRLEASVGKAGLILLVAYASVKLCF